GKLHHYRLTRRLATAPGSPETPHVKSDDLDEERSRRALARLAVATTLALPLAGCAPTFLQNAATEPGAVRLESGGVMRTLEAGTGVSPRPEDRVQVSYEARSTDGTVFASSREREAGGVLGLAIEAASPCWRDALLRMHVGEKARVVCVS